MFVVPTSRSDGAAPLHHVGHAEGTADLDEFAARDDDLLAAGKGVQAEQDGRRVVVHGRGGLDAGEPLQDAFDMDMAFAAFTCRNIVFKVGIAPADLDNALDGLLGQDRAAEVRMHDHAGGVDDRLEARFGQLGRIVSAWFRTPSMENSASSTAVPSADWRMAFWFGRSRS